MTEDCYKNTINILFCNPPLLLRNANSFEKEVTALINIDGNSVYWSSAYFSYDITLKIDIILSVG